VRVHCCPVRYDQYRLVDLARTVVGVGTRSWSVLMLGDDQQDPLFLQVKEAAPFLGWVRVHSDDGRRRDFYVPQLRDPRGPVAIETMAPPTIQVYGELGGWTLTRAHARSGDHVAIAASWAPAMPSSMPSASSQSPTQIRTSATTPTWSKRSNVAGSRQSTTCSWSTGTA
jgi:hypothetical protein